MKLKILIVTVFWIWTINLIAQDSISQKQRLDFAKSYFEIGGSYMPSFTGKQLINDQVTSFTQSASLNQYLTWGAFHFWGHAEFYVTFPLRHSSLTKNDSTDYELLHSVATGARFYPWVVKEGKIRPYIGVSFGALDFKQKIKPDENQPKLSKDIMLNYEAGLSYTHKNIGVRLGATYFTDNTWQYPISRTQKSEITTPAYAIQMGLLYTFESTKKSKNAAADEWNSYPRVSKLSYQAKKVGDFFIGVGPSASYSLVKSGYNMSQFPFLKERLISKAYFDLSIGYQFIKANLFVALSFRNPTYETAGFGAKQMINKKSFALEINKYLTDYTGFAPYIGFNVAYDNIRYVEAIDGVQRAFNFSGRIEPGMTVGWDIVPGKTSEAIILRTNLRWYPLSNFAIDGKIFHFSQLEYNLIQVIFYPDRLQKKR